MTSSNQPGGCMCGAVRFTTDGAPSRIIHCHCTDCRGHTGAPMATLAVYWQDQVTFTGTPRKPFQSSPDVQRTFCQDCGTSLTFETDLRNFGMVCAIHISAFDHPNQMAATHHSYYSEKIDWFEVLDDLPRYKRLVVDGELVQTGSVTGR